MHKKSNFSAPIHGVFACFFTAVVALPGALVAQETSLAGKIVVLPIGEHTLVEKAQIDALQAGLEKASAERAAAVILEIDSPGGFAIATRRAMEKLGAMDGVATYAFIKGQAVGEPALVALATDGIYFAPDGVMGSAKPEEIEWRGKKDALPIRLVEKNYTDYADVMKGVVATKGRSELLVDGFLDRSVEVKLDGKVLSEADDVLVLRSKSPVAAGEVGSVADLVKAAGLSGEVIVRSYLPKAVTSDEARKPEAEELATPKEADKKEAEKETTFGQTREESYAGKVVVIEVGDETLIRKTKFEFMRRILKKANEDGAAAVVFDMDTPGGYLWETADLMMDDLQKVTIPTYTYVNPEASSAGSMIAIATKKIYMHTPSTIGAAGIVSSMGEIEGTMKEKVERTFLDTVAEVAELNGHDPKLCMAFVKKELEYTASIPVVEPDGSLSSTNILYVKPGELLSLNSKEATQMVDGKPLFATGTAQTLEELLEKEGLTGQVVRAKPLGFEAVADWIVKIAPFLLLLAMAGAYLEVNSPGFGVAGTLSLIFFAIFFFGHQAAGKLAGYEVIGVFMLGIVLVIVEFFVFPGMMVFGAVGLLLIIGSLLFAMVDQFDFKNIEGDFEFDRLVGGLGTPATNLIIALGGAAVLVMLLMRYLPDMPFMQRRMLAGVSSGGSNTLYQVSGGTASDAAADLIGREGIAQCDLKPAGKGMFGDDLLDITAESEFVSEGTSVRVVNLEGGRIVVEKI